MSDGNILFQNQETRKAFSISKNQPSSRKRQRKARTPVRFSPTAEQSEDVLVCRNPTCRASLSPDVTFCKRCCCSICHLFDDNKDPSLWLVCAPESGSRNACGLACHIECALLLKRAGVVAPWKFMQLDGSYLCTSCGEVTGILEFWKKQLTIAKDAERVHTLRFRISLCYKLLDGTSRFSELHELVRDAKGKLEADTGLVDETERARGTVSRLSHAGEVQKLISLAIDKADEWLASVSNSCQKCTGGSFPDGSSSALMVQDPGKVISLNGAQEECFGKVVPEVQIKESCELRSSERSERTENQPWHLGIDLNVAYVPCLNDELISPESFGLEDNAEPSKHTVNADDDASGDSRNWALVPSREVPAVDTLSLERALIPHHLPCDGNGVVVNEHPLRISNELVSPDEFELCVKTIRSLEIKGYIEQEFRLKTLTWFINRATDHERRVVRTFVQTMLDDPGSLAEQLVDTFSDTIYSKKPRSEPR